MQAESNQLQTKLSSIELSINEINMKCERQSEMLVIANAQPRQLKAQLAAALLESTAIRAKHHLDLKDNRKLIKQVSELEIKVHELKEAAKGRKAVIKLETENANLKAQLDELLPNVIGTCKHSCV